MNDGQQNKHPQEEEIDLLELALKVWAERRWISVSYTHLTLPTKA